MEKRAFNRIPVNIEISFFCRNTHYLGSVTNLSEKGMFISADELCFPSDAQLEIFIPLKKEILQVSAVLSRIIMSPDSHNGVGVELIDPPRDYLEFVDSLRAAYKS